MYIILSFLALWIGIARAQFDIPTAMMMGLEPQQAMMFMSANSGTGGGTGGGMDGMGGGMGTGTGTGSGGGGGGGGEFGQAGGQGSTRGSETMGGVGDGMGGGSGNMEPLSGSGGGNNRGGNNRFSRPNFNRQPNNGRLSTGGGGGGGFNNNMGGSSSMMSMMLCQETPSRFRELPCNLNNPQSCPMAQYLTCQSGVYFYPVCCAKDWRSLRIVDVMF